MEAVAVTHESNKDVERALFKAVEKQPAWVEVDMENRLRELGLAEFVPLALYPPAFAVRSYCLNVAPKFSHASRARLTSWRVRLKHIERDRAQPPSFSSS